MSFKKMILFCVLLMVFPLMQQSLFGYICNTDKFRDLTVTVKKREIVTELNTPFDVEILLKNESSSNLEVQISVGSIETVKVHGPSERTLTVPPGETTTTFQFLCESETYSAHYPIHVTVSGKWENEEFQLKPVQVIETNFGPLGMSRRIVGKTIAGTEVGTGDLVTDASQLPVISVPEQGGLSLFGSDAYRVIWRQFKDGDDAPFSVLNVGWQGDEEKSRTNLSKIRMTRSGVSREAFSIHPPYNGGAGTMFSEHLVALPDTQPILFSAYTALRDLHPSEPPSDGVTFAVWVGDEKIGEKHCTSRAWEPFEVDLSQFAGQTVLLRLQSDPGPKHDTTCDSAFWGTPLLFAGERPKILTPQEKTELFAENLKALQTGKSDNGLGTVVFQLEGDMRAVITKGHYGFIDGVIGIGNKDHFVQYDGLRVEIEGQPLGTEMSALGYGECAEMIRSIRMAGRMDFPFHKIVTGDKELNMSYSVRYKGAAIQLSVECDDPLAITKVEFGPATQHAHRVYFGHGYCITEPERFDIINGGHMLSTSHVGFDFDNGLSLLMATTFAPDRFIVDPDNKTYTLSVCNATTMTLLPGNQNALECAIRYRPLYDKQAAPGVAKKAGRFVFDVWGGRYADHTRRLQQQIDYGVTDALFVNHNWQRWGYDNRLPDIWPPNPRFGTYDEMRETLELCRKHGILYGLHDNYIDIYPDADDFHYDLVSFNADGRPRKAWCNYGIDAQSYQFRPDRFMPLLERNFATMMPEFPQTTYFVDVFASIHLHDFWDREGKRHGQAEMLGNWCKAFDRIREHLGNDNPTISEAGSDFLIGHLDGADCQFLMLSAEPGDFRINIRCKEWARVPWFDAVNHTRFSLHGVGYDSRYVASRGNDQHGYMSDDYMSTEVLTGHALQVGWGQIGRDSIRKYWLLQPVARRLADQEIMAIQYGQNPENAPDLFVAAWGEKTSPAPEILVAVNQGAKDFSVERSFLLPQYGYMCYSSDFFSGIIKIQVDSPNKDEFIGQPIIEYSNAVVDGEKQVYFNPRQVGTNALPVMPVVDEFHKVGDDQFRFDINWNVFRSLKDREGVKDFGWFLHLEPPRMNWHEKLELTAIGHGLTETPCSQWDANQQMTTDVFRFPEELNAGTYNVLIGLWDVNGDKQRVKMLGPSPDNSSRVLLGKLKVEKRGNQVTKLEFLAENEDSPELFARLLPTERHVLDAIVAPGTPQLKTRFPIPLRSTGAVRLCYPHVTELHETLEMTVTPLPEEPATTVVINLDGTSNSLVPNVKNITCDSLIAVDREGKKLREVEFQVANDELRFDTQPGEFAYKIVVRYRGGEKN